MIISIFKASGHSMEPIIKNGSFFIASSVPLKVSNIKMGDIVIFRKEDKNIVKKITKIEGEKVFVEGENKSDSKNFSPIKRKEILGKVIWTF